MGAARLRRGRLPGHRRAPGGRARVFAIQLPPPNVTGTLHMGHAFNQTIMDSLTRYHRMRGFNTVWVPGTDHAGIATQIVVERQLQEQGISRHDMGPTTRGAQELRRQGVGVEGKERQHHHHADAPHGRQRGLEPRILHHGRQAVQGGDRDLRALYEQGLIYRGKRLVNWDPVLQSAVSDLEVESEEKDGSLWHIAYPLADGSGERWCGHHPARDHAGRRGRDGAPRGRALHAPDRQDGELPLCDREIPVIADDYVDKEFGTGVVKVTPAHDQNDYAVGQRHKLPMIGVLTLDAKINDNAPAAYRGLDRFVARKAVVADLEAWACWSRPRSTS
jgi:valyl-tRNA synthetase